MSIDGAKITKNLSIDGRDFPRLAVNALHTLGYRNEMHDKHDNKIIYIDRCEQTYGADTWNCHFQAILIWEEMEGGLSLTIKVKEKNYGADYADVCFTRAREILREIDKVVARTKVIAPKEMPYKARFAEISDLKTQGYVLSPKTALGTASPDFPNNFILRTMDDIVIRLSERMSHRHVLVCGPTGSGKSMSIFVPNLIERIGTSAIVTEAVSGNKEPVLYHNTASWRAKAGQEIIYFNPADLRSHRINPIDQVKTFDDAQHLAHLIIANTTAESHMGDQVWSQSETHLLQALILHVAGFRKDLNRPSQLGDNANLGYIRRFLRKGPDGMEPELRESSMPLAKEEYLAYLNNSSPNFRFGVISGLLMRLSLFANPKIAALTEVTDLAIDELKDKLFTIYLATPVHRSDYAPLSAMIFNFCLSLVLRDLENFKHPLAIFADEFTNFGYLPELPRYMTVIRNAEIGISLGIQDPVQLERVYKEKDARILFGQPRTKIFFAPADDQVALRISRMLGTMTIKESVNASGQLSDRELPRPLLDVFELMQLERTSQYVCSTSTETLKLAPILSWNDYKEALGFRPPERPLLKIEDEPNEDSPDDAPSVSRLPKQDSRQHDVNKCSSDSTLEETYWDKLFRRAAPG